MKIKKLITQLALPSLALGAIMLANSCRPMVTPEQMQELKELRQKKKSLNEQISENKNEKSKLKSEIDARERELRDCSDKAEFVKKKLANWPNVWPNWNPNEEKEGKEEETK